MNIFCRKGDLVRLRTPTISAWQGIGIAAETVYDDGDPDTVVPFYKQEEDLEGQAPSIALIGEVELVRPSNPKTESTDEELANTYWKAWHEYHDRTDSVLHAAGLRAVLARYGNRTPAPIPLAERLPTEADCDAEGRCLLFGRYLLSGEAAWIYGYPAWAQRFANSYSHWLPHWALPVPGVEA